MAGSSSSPGRWYFSTERGRKGLKGGANGGLRMGWEGETPCKDEQVPEISNSREIPGIVSSKSNNSSTVNNWVRHQVIPSTEMIGLGSEAGVTLISPS